MSKPTISFLIFYQPNNLVHNIFYHQFNLNIHYFISASIFLSKNFSATVSVSPDMSDIMHEKLTVGKWLKVRLIMMVKKNSDQGVLFVLNIRDKYVSLLR